MISRRRRSRGGYMIRVPSTPVEPVLSVSQANTFITSNTVLGNQEQYSLTMNSNQLHVIYQDLGWSPVVYIIQELYEDEVLKPIFFTGNVITFIAMTSGHYSGNTSDDVEIVAESIDISYLQNLNYLLEKHLLVNITQNNTYESYLFPLPVQDFDIKYKALEKVTLTYSSEHIDTQYFSQDQMYNSNVSPNQVYLQIQVNTYMEEAFDKYIILYDPTIARIRKFKTQTNKTAGQIYDEVLEDSTF